MAETEEEVYEHLGLPWSPPTLREDRGEIEAALAGELPSVVQEKDIAITLYDEPCTLKEHVANLPYRAVWVEKGQAFEGCFGAYNRYYSPASTFKHFRVRRGYRLFDVERFSE